MLEILRRLKLHGVRLPGLPHAISCGSVHCISPDKQVSCRGLFCTYICIALLSSILISPSLQDPDGYISIDCGLAGESYKSVQNLTWLPDDSFITTGYTAPVQNPYRNLSRIFETVRYFPAEDTPIKNCYELPAIPSMPYLIRAYFYYGNYNNMFLAPSFLFIVDGDVWGTISTSDTLIFQLFTVAKSSNISVCLARTSQSIRDDPYISALELRPLSPNMTYNLPLSHGFGLIPIIQYNIGSTASVRYPDDAYDRLWLSYPSDVYMETSDAVGTDQTKDQPPMELLQTAMTGKGPLVFSGMAPEPYYHINLYFAEISENVSKPGQRVFDVYCNQFQNGRVPWAADIDPFNASHGRYMGLELSSTENKLAADESLILSFSAHNTSAFGPLISGIEILAYTPFLLENLTYAKDVEAIQMIRDGFGLRAWSGDPCLPIGYGYSWVNCTTSKPPRISSINLDNYNLTGSISPSINALTACTEIVLSNNALMGEIPKLSSLIHLRKLDIQNNMLTGLIPSSLGDMLNLTELFVQNNNLSGNVPPELLQRKKQKTLVFEYEGNPSLGCDGALCFPTTTPSDISSPSSTTLQNSSKSMPTISIAISLNNCNATPWTKIFIVLLLYYTM